MTISFRDVYFAYELFGEASVDENSFQLRGLSFEFSSRECIALAGRSGSGKTTLLQMFNGLLRPAQGEVLVDGRNIHAPGYDRSALRQRVGLAFQFPEAQLFAATVREDVAFAPTQQKLPPAEISARLRQAIDGFGVPESFLDRDPFTLSEGEKRRVALAGILAMQPEMLVLDEPTAGLDTRSVTEIKSLLRRWHAQGRGVAVISHDADLIAELAQRIVVLEAGMIVFDGPPERLWGGAEHTAASQIEVRARAGLGLPRAERLRRLLREKNIDARVVL